MAKLLTEATVQEIQLELIRRTQFNAFDGEAVVDSLLQHRALWISVLMDSLYGSGMDRLSAGSSLKLRDLADNFWHVDTLYILTPDAHSAHRFADLIEAEDWGGEVLVHDEEDNVQSALGGGEPGCAIISIWWD